MNDQRIGRVILAALSVAGAARAQSPAGAPPDSASGAPAQSPATSVRSPEPDPAATPIDARSAVSRALAGSPAFGATKLGVARAEQGVLAEEGRYPYVFRADAGHTRSWSPSRDLGATSSYDVGTGVRRTFPFGTTAEVRLEGQRFEENAALAGSGVASVSGYGVRARMSVVQPLLRGAGRSVGELGLREARESRTLSEKTRRRAESELVRDVLLAYWELWYAEESVRIERAALELARAQERQADQQREHGALAPADVLSFSTRVATLEESGVAALLQRRERSRELNRLIGASPERAAELSASDTPVPGSLPSAQQIEAALRHDSVELAELEAQLRLARTRAEVAGEAGRPRLDLDGSFQTYGESERPVTALRRAGELDWLTVHVGATFELPLDATQRNAEKQSALLAIRVAEHNLRDLRDRLAADAANTVARAYAAEERLGLALRTVAVAEKAHEAARARFELGGGIALQVQQAEEELRRARLSLARTRVDLVAAQIGMRHLAGLLTSEYTRS